VTVKVLILTDDVLGPSMAGSAVRAWELGRVLAGAGHEVRIGGGPGSSPPGAGGPEVTAEASWRWAEAVLAAPWTLPPRAFVGRHLLVADVITPLLAELAEMPEGPRVLARRRTARARVPLVSARADALLAGGPAQIGWWTERLHRRLGLPVVTVPFGVPEEVPPAERADIAGVPDDWAVVLWWGGVWPWLDLDTLLDARARLGTAPVSVVVPVAPRPGAAAFGWSSTDLARAMGRHRLRPPQVVGLERWVPYCERHAILNRASLLAVLHRSSDEAALSFRTRALDGVWAGVPLLLSEGGEVSRLARQHGWGGVVPPGDAAAAAAAIQLLLSEREQARCRLNLSRSRPDWTWRRVAEPLLAVLPELPRVRRGSLAVAAGRAALALADVSRWGESR
jgi:glycosyltransferase involved in cell wall biosynthesis